MIHLGIFKMVAGKMKFEEKILSVDGYARWRRLNKAVFLSPLLPVGFLTTCAMRTGFISDVRLVPMPQSTRNYPENTLAVGPLNDGIIFYLAHRSSDVPTYSGTQINDLMQKIIHSRAYLFRSYIQTNSHPYLSRMCDFTYNESCTGLQNPFEYDGLQGTTINQYITWILSDIKARVRNYSLIQTLTEIAIPVSRMCHIRRDSWKQSGESAKLFPYNEMGFNSVNRRYKDKVVSCLIECTGAIDIQTQDPSIGFMGMRTSGFETYRDRSQSQNSDQSPSVTQALVVRSPRVEITDKFTDSLTLPDGTHLSVSQSNLSDPSDESVHQKCVEQLALPGQEAEANPRSSEANSPKNSPAKSLALKNSPIGNDNNKDKPGPSQNKSIDKRPESPEIRFLTVEIGPDHCVRVFPYVFTKSTIPDDLRRTITTDQGLPVYVTHEGVVKIQSETVGILGQDAFESYGPYVTTWDPIEPNSMPQSTPPKTPSTGQMSKNSPEVSQNSPDSSSQENNENSPQLFRTKIPEIGTQGTDRSLPSESSDLEGPANVVVRTKSINKPISRIITDRGTQTNRTGSAMKHTARIIINNKPAEICMSELNNRQIQINEHMDDILKKFTHEVVDLPHTIIPNQTQLMNIVRATNDFTASLNLGTEKADQARKMLTEVILELFQSTLGVTVTNSLLNIRKLNQEKNSFNVLMRMLNNYSDRTIKTINQIDNFPGCLSTFHDTETEKIMRVYRNLASTLDEYKNEMLSAIQVAESQAQEIYNKAGYKMAGTQVVEDTQENQANQMPGPSRTRTSPICIGQKRLILEPESKECPKKLKKSK